MQSREREQLKLRLPPVSRIVGHSSSLDMNLSLDVAVDIYPVTVAQNLTVQIASSLGRTAGDGEGGDNDRDAWRLEGGGGLADEFDYVMYGKVRLATACVIDRQALMIALCARSTSTTTHPPRQSQRMPALAAYSWRSLVPIDISAASPSAATSFSSSDKSTSSLYHYRLSKKTYSTCAGDGEQRHGLCWRSLLERIYGLRNRNRFGATAALACIASRPRRTASRPLVSSSGRLLQVLPVGTMHRHARRLKVGL